jgi:hypothetical protein
MDGEVGDDGLVDLSGDVALQAADDLFAGLALGESLGHVGLGGWMPAESADDDGVERTVGLAVTAAVEPVSLLAARRRVDRGRPAERRERGGRAQQFGVVAGGGEQCHGVLRADAVHRSGGDRQLNRALYHVAITKQRCDPATHTYIAQRTAEGKTEREAIRCIKRFIARRIWRLLEHPPITT